MDVTKTGRKDTDITWVLFAIFFVLLCALFVSTTNGLINKSTSVLTRAEGADDAICTGSIPLKVDTTADNIIIKYDSSSDYCPNVDYGSQVKNAVIGAKNYLLSQNNGKYTNISYHGECRPGYIKDDTTRCGKGNILGCCRLDRSYFDIQSNTQKPSQVEQLGAPVCQAKYGRIDATCAASCGGGTTQATPKGTKECVYVKDSAKIFGGVCCVSNTPVPNPSQPSVSVTSCPIDDNNPTVMYDCAKTFLNPLSNTQGLTPLCLKIDVNGFAKYRCGYKNDIAYHSQACNGQQWILGAYKTGESTPDQQCFVGNTNQPKITIQGGPDNGADGCMLIRLGTNGSHSQNQCIAAMGTFDQTQH